MKAIVYDGIQKVQCREVSDPKIEKDDDIIVKVTSTAICGSDLHLVHGLVKGMYDGFVLGHETMGIVEEVGNFFTRNITLKMGQCPATRYVEPILEKIKSGEFDATDIITHKLSLEEGRHAYEIFDKKEDNCIKVILKP